MTNEKLAELLKLDRSRLPPDGGDRFNRLIFARSPYLLQHAENPVDWREWGDAAFEEARRRDVPLLVSVGYATCHWCHVMAAESFSDPEVAAALNSSFVAIKVDREERPDIDDYCMAASQALTGSGGWPLNVFMDHDRRPFFAITYLPKEPRHQTPGFLNLLTNLSTLWQKQRPLVNSNADEIGRSLAALAEPQEAAGRDIDRLTGMAVQQLADMYDKGYGGFGRAVKFPMPAYLLFLLSRGGDRQPEAVAEALETLEIMARSGINDQLGGGFHRYSVDRHWQIPHFEKMLYDQALLITSYCEAFKQSGNSLFLETAERTARFTVNELMNSEGGFAAGLDADSDGEEGLFYTWRYAELAALLGEDCSAAAAYWGVTREGILDGRSTLHAASADGQASALASIPVADRAALLNQWRERLLAARSRRERPLCDPKVICAWNGLMISALVKLAAAANEDHWLQTAAATARFIMEKMVDPEGRLLRNWLGASAPVFAFAEDYACFCLGLADLAEASDEPLWREQLAFFGNELRRLFIDADGGVGFSGRDTERLPLSIPPLQDGVMPSAAGSTALLLLRMGRIFGDDSCVAAAAALIRSCRGVMEKNPAACLSLLMAAEDLERMQKP